MAFVRVRPQSVSMTPAQFAAGFLKTAAAFQKVSGRPPVVLPLPILRAVPGGMGQLTPIFNSTTGQYEGGSVFYDVYCNSTVGQLLSPSMCGIPSLQQTQATQTEELASTAAPVSAQLAAIAAGNTAVTAACSADPSDCAAQNAAASYPILSSLFGPNVVADVGGIQPDGSQNPLGSTSFWFLIAAVGVGILIIAKG